MIEFSPSSDYKTVITWQGERCTTTVDVGTVVGRVVAARNGEPGADVHGGPWPPRKPWGTAVKLGPGVRLMPGGTGEVVAEGTRGFEVDLDKWQTAIYALEPR